MYEMHFEALQIFPDGNNIPTQITQYQNYIQVLKVAFFCRLARDVFKGGCGRLNTYIQGNRGEEKNHAVCI